MFVKTCSIQTLTGIRLFFCLVDRRLSGAVDIICTVVRCHSLVCVWPHSHISLFSCLCEVNSSSRTGSDSLCCLSSHFSCPLQPPHPSSFSFLSASLPSGLQGEHVFMLSCTPLPGLNGNFQHNAAHFSELFRNVIVHWDFAKQLC